MVSAPSLDAWGGPIGKHGDHGTKNGIIDLRASSSPSSGMLVSVQEKSKSHTFTSARCMAGPRAPATQAPSVG